MSDLRIHLDHHSGIPIYRQIISQILYAIARGDVAPGTQLPTVRQLAVDLSVNPNTIIKAYKELEIRGNLETQQGTGTFISDVEVEISAREKKQALESLCRDLVVRAAAQGLDLDEVIEALRALKEENRDGTTD
ncbi:MAG: GntR family transcriptional regulator [Myxococcota bacterium]